MESSKIIESRKKYLNQRYQNNDGEYFIIIEYNGAHKIIIKFDDGTILNNIFSGNINCGKVRNPNYIKESNSLSKSVCEIGYLGIGKYTSLNNNFYHIWTSMLQRCYDTKNQQRYSTYSDCSVDPIWHNFQTFAEWCSLNHIEGFAMDKDILIKGNKIYSSNTCCFVPRQINQLFTKCNSLRGQYSIGVRFNKLKNKFQSIITICGQHKNLGSFDTPEEAFNKYKFVKEDYIKRMSNKYKSQLEDNVYQALMNYIVEITD